MSDNSNITITDNGESNAKYDHATGVLNISLGVVLFVDSILLGIVAVCCMMMSFSLFFMAAIPAFLLTCALCAVAVVAAIANIATGIGTLVVSQKGGTVSLIFSVATIVVDVAVIPANIVALLCGVYLLYTEISFLSILIFIVAAAALALAVTSLILTVIRLVKSNKA